LYIIALVYLISPLYHVKFFGGVNRMANSIVQTTNIDIAPMQEPP
jgi:hypothetical protein